MPNPPETSAELLERLQHQVALFARRAEQTRLGGVGRARNSMDRAAYLLLNRLDRQGPMGVKALAEAMGIDSSTVTRQVAPLVDTGLVKRTSHPEDGRAVVLAVSPRGRGRLEEVRDSRRRLMADVTEGWTFQEQETFTTLLVRFNAGLAEWHAGLGHRDCKADHGSDGHGANARDAGDAADAASGPSQEAAREHRAANGRSGREPAGVPGRGPGSEQPGGTSGGTSNGPGSAASSGTSGRAARLATASGAAQQSAGTGAAVGARTDPQGA